MNVTLVIFFTDSGRDFQETDLGNRNYRRKSPEKMVKIVNMALFDILNTGVPKTFLHQLKGKSKILLVLFFHATKSGCIFTLAAVSTITAHLKLVCPDDTMHIVGFKVVFTFCVVRFLSYGRLF